MSIDRLIVPMLGVRLFRDLTPRQLKMVALGAERIAFAAGEKIIREGETGDAAYLIVDGSAEIEQPATLGTAGTGVAIGALIAEMAMLVETVHFVTVVAETDVKALVFRREVMQDLMTRDPELAAHFVEVIRRGLEKMAADLHAIEATLASESAGDVLPLVNTASG